ncbi:MAG: polyprenyl synthetase family protein [Acidimicrobiales bacterium]
MASSPLLALPSVPGDLARVEDALRASVRADDDFLTEIASHLIQAGGKRGRPAFAIGVAASSQPTARPVSDDVIMGAVSVELVHLGSLYHDDVMDDATTRRTVESVNARWGNLRAILAGDFLLARASEIAASLGNEVAGLLASTIGRLCEGQVLELQDTYNAGRSEARYLTSIEGKTASLYATACRIGAITGGLDRDRIEAATEFGLRYGMAFQIVDDVLDVVATDEQLGKPAGHDLVEGVYTLPVLRTLAADDERAGRLSGLLGRPLSIEEMHEARALVREDGHVVSALATAEAYVDRAVAALQALEPSEATDALAGAARHLLDSVPAIAGA